MTDHMCADTGKFPPCWLKPGHTGAHANATGSFWDTSSNRVLTDRCMTCGHDKRNHIYHEGACRPGFVCAFGCEKFVPMPHAIPNHVPLGPPSTDEPLTTEQLAATLDDFQAGYEFGYADGTVGEYRKPRRRDAGRATRNQAADVIERTLTSLYEIEGDELWDDLPRLAQNITTALAKEGIDA